MEYVITTANIYSHENKDLDALDLLGEYPRNEIDRLVHMFLRGILYELVTRTGLETYNKYVTNDHHGRVILYVVLTKSLY